MLAAPVVGRRIDQTRQQGRPQYRELLRERILNPDQFRVIRGLSFVIRAPSFRVFRGP